MFSFIYSCEWKGELSLRSVFSTILNFIHGKVLLVFPNFFVNKYCCCKHTLFCEVKSLWIVYNTRSIIISFETSSSKLFLLKFWLQFSHSAKNYCESIPQRMEKLTIEKNWTHSHDLTTIQFKLSSSSSEENFFLFFHWKVTSYSIYLA